MNDNKPSSPVCYADDDGPAPAQTVRLLILGAGAVGGYLGGRLQAAGANVTFLVRDEDRAGALRERGLHIYSTLGDTQLQPVVTTPAQVRPEYDLVILACKACDLDAAIEVLVPIIGDRTCLLPLLNGIAHLAILDSRFGISRIMGGLAHLAVEQRPDGGIYHLNDFHRLVFGSRDEAQHELAARFATLLARTSLEYEHSTRIEQELWGKFVFLATLAGATCLFRGPIGTILQTVSGEQFVQGLLEECIAIAAAAGHALPADRLAGYRDLLADRSADYTASMLRDIEAGRRTEAEHILGDMLVRAQKHGLNDNCLRLAYSHLQVYEMRRQS